MSLTPIGGAPPAPKYSGSNLTQTLQFNATWELNLDGFALKQIPDDVSFLKSGVWGEVPVASPMNFSLIPEPNGNQLTQVLRVNYPAGTYRSPGNPLVRNGTVIGGANFFARPFGNNGFLRAILEYDVFFPSGFPFKLGGKLPGFYGAASGAAPSEACSGGQAASGTNCWSTRLMWRATGAGEVYAYIPTQPNLDSVCDSKKYPLNTCKDAEFGLSLGRTAYKFETDKWNRIGLHVQVNDINQKNGFIQLYVDEKKVIDIQEVTFRTGVSAGSLLVTDLFFSTFFGGSNLAYATPVDTFAIFRKMNMSVSQQKYVPPPNENGAHSFQSLPWGLLMSLLFGVFLL